MKTLEEEIIAMDQKVNFEKDVFISYAHIDDQPITLNKDAKGWISNFHTLLKRRLDMVVGREMNIWRDEKLQGNTEFGPEIVEQFPKMRVMISIITPRYVKSDWCRREMQEFYRAANSNGGISFHNQWRIFKVVKTPFDRSIINTLPAEINKIYKDILDYQFYIKESETGDKFSELNPEGSADNVSTQKFIEKLEDVVQNIAKLIEQLNNEGKVNPDQKKIYLAETTYDLHEYREKLVRQLEDTGYIVLPDTTLPGVLNEFNTAVQTFIDQSVLSLHLISSTNYGSPPEGTIKSKVIIQNEIAAKKSASNNLPRLIWIPPATTLADTDTETKEMQSEFLKKLKTAKENTPDILEGITLEDFKEAIANKFKAIEQEEKARKEAEEKAKQDDQTPNVTDVAASAEVKKVYLICNDQADLETTGPLRKLIKNNNLSLLLPNFSQPELLQKQHADYLKICDAVIIYFGSGNDLWMDNKAGDIDGLIRDAAKPLLAKAIYTTGTDDDGTKADYKWPGGAVIQGIEGLKPELFNDFFQKLK
ncbi:MAG: TIR domain-containing protein [Bacteroidia bacterium]